MTKPGRWPLIFWLVTLLVVFAYILLTSSNLPEKVADHFGANGTANGWSDRSNYVFFSLTFGLGVSLFIIGLLYCIRFFPASMLNVPKAAYWRRPENFRAACDMMFHHGLIFSSVLTAWQGGLHTLILKANATSTPHLDNTWLVVLTSALLLASLIWIVSVLLIFSRNAVTEAKSAT